MDFMTKETINYLRSAIAVSAGAMLALSSFLGGSISGVVVSWITAFLIYEVLRGPRVILQIFICGVSFHLIAFYWLTGTLDRFGGFGPLIALFLFILFCIISSIQFLVCGWVCTLYRAHFGQRWYGVATAIVWYICESLFSRLFPWTLSSPQIAWSSFAALASIGGVSLLSLVMLLVASTLRERWHRSDPLFARFSRIVFLGFIGILVWGYLDDLKISREIFAARKLRVGMVQGNLSTKVKGDLNYLEANLDIYRSLTKQLLEQRKQQRGVDFVIWPESVVTRWMPHDLRRIEGTEFDVLPDLGIPLLFGALTYEPRSVEEMKQAEELFGDDYEALQRYRYKAYNSAVGRSVDGLVAGVFSKRVLMPLGEYLPLESRFPSIRKLSPQSGNFASGTEPPVLHFSTPEGQDFRVAPLICYEDLVPSLSVIGSNAGAQFLANLTNDAWYGDTSAPYQHHLLASWRAVENRRFLLRVTNTGFTAAVDPLGREVDRLPTFSEGAVVVEVPLLESQTWYAKTESMRSLFRWGIVILALIGWMIYRKLAQRKLQRKVFSLN